MTEPISVNCLVSLFNVIWYFFIPLSGSLAKSSKIETLMLFVVLDIYNFVSSKTASVASKSEQSLAMVKSSSVP